VEIAYSEKLPKVKGKASRLHQVFFSILVNAERQLLIREKLQFPHSAKKDGFTHKLPIMALE